MKIIVVSPKNLFHNHELVEELINRGGIFYQDANIDLATIPELTDEEDKVLAIDEFSIKDSFQGINRMLSKMKNIKHIVGLSSRFEQFDLDEATKLGIKYSNNPAPTARSVSELAFTLMLMLLRKYPLMTKSDYQYFSYDVLGEEMANKTVGIIGYGNIGSRVATLCERAGMVVSFWDRVKKASQLSQEPWDLILKKQILFIALTTNNETKQLFDDQFYQALKPDQYVIDPTASDALYDKNRLIEMVNHKRLGGLAFEAEGPKSKFIEPNGNIVITPHMGWATKEGLDRLYRQWTEEIIRASEGQPLFVVN